MTSGLSPEAQALIDAAMESQDPVALFTRAALGQPQVFLELAALMIDDDIENDDEEDGTELHPAFEEDKDE